MSTELLNLILASVAGFMLGVMFFGGLRWTIQKGLSSQHAAPWFLGSLLLRMSITVAGFYLVGRGHWERLLVCLLGFLVARLVVTQLTRATDQPVNVAKDIGDAPQPR